MQDCLARFQHHLDAVIRNFPNPIIRLVMRVGALPLGITYKPASDKQNYRLAKAILQPGAWRDRMTRDLYVNFDENDPTGVLEAGLLAVTDTAEIETKFLKGLRKGLYEWRHDQDAIGQACEQGVLNDQEAKQLRRSLALTEKVVAVDHFEPEALSTAQSHPADMPKAS